MTPNPTSPALPRIIWTLWLQGWDNAPEIVRACQQTWRKNNKNWDVRALELADVTQVLKGDELISLVAEKDLPPEAFSDVVRTALLRKYGGVWVDSTCYCLKPLDEWLHQVLPSGFFAFAKPGPDRMLSSWFLAAAENNYVIERWYRLTSEYWSTRNVRDHYFWSHYLFAQIYAEDEVFRNKWDATPEISADGPHYYLPYYDKLRMPVSASDHALVEGATVPLLKLTHKLGDRSYSEGTVLRYLNDRVSLRLISQ